MNKSYHIKRVLLFLVFITRVKYHYTTYINYDYPIFSFLCYSYVPLILLNVNYYSATDYKREDFDPNFVVLALPCQNSRKAAAPGRIAAEVNLSRSSCYGKEGLFHSIQ